MAAVGALTSVASGVFGMMQAQYQAEVAKMNEQVAKQNAIRATQRAGIEAQEKDMMETRALLGEQEVAQAASGVSVAGKSQVQTRNTARLLGRRDAENIIAAGALEGYNHRVEAANFRAEGQAAKTTGWMNLIGGFLDAAGQFGGSMIGGKGTSAKAEQRFGPRPIPKPEKRPIVPIPRPKPPVPKAPAQPYTNPLLRRRFGH